jgi:hypothetical protein
MRGVLGMKHGSVIRYTMKANGKCRYDYGCRVKRGESAVCINILGQKYYYCTTHAVQLMKDLTGCLTPVEIAKAKCSGELD